MSSSGVSVRMRSNLSITFGCELFSWSKAGARRAAAYRFQSKDGVIAWSSATLITWITAFGSRAAAASSLASASAVSMRRTASAAGSAPAR